MRRSTWIALWTFFVLVGSFGLLLVWPTLIGCLMGVLLIFAVWDHSSRRHRNAVRTLNSAIRAVCNHDGAIGKVAVAFSRSGPLSGPCYEYARRLMMGENPIDAAAVSRVPLQLQTAIALQSPTASQRSLQRDQQRIGNELALVDSTLMPAYGQFIYLTATALVTCVVLLFMSAFIVPTMERMFEEFGLELPHAWLFSTAPSLWILFLLGLIGMFIVPLLNRGHLLGFRLPRWVPAMPRLAERKAEILNGLAAAIDLGWPMGRALATGHTISTQSYERRTLEKSMQLIEQGIEPAVAIQRAGWIEADEAAWLVGATPQRTAELLRTIADQNIRDARSNLRWMMAILFPVLVVLLGFSVMAFAYGFFATLTRLISGLG